MFIVREVVWGKVKGYPWWPAEISKLPSSDQNFFKVSFIGENNHAFLQQKFIRKYQQNYNSFKAHKYKGLQASIQLADEQIMKKKSKHNVSDQNQKDQEKPVFKLKRIIRKISRRHNIKKKCINIKTKKQTTHLQLKQTIQYFQRNHSLQKQVKPEEQQLIIHDIEKEISNGEQSEFQSDDLNFNKIGQNVNRKKIQTIESDLMTFIAKLNSNNYQNSSQCFQMILNIQKESFKPEQIAQSKITNMISYIFKKLNSSANPYLNKQQIGKIDLIGKTLRNNVIQYLCNVNYYEFFLKKMQKNVSSKIPEFIKKQINMQNSYIKKLKRNQ